MKTFRKPEVEFVKIAENDVIVASGECHGFLCQNYQCPECSWCTGTGYCGVYEVK